MPVPKHKLLWHRKLAALYPCDEAMDFALQHKTLASAWKACHRGDWMKWLIKQVWYRKKPGTFAKLPAGFIMEFDQADLSSFSPSERHVATSRVVRKFFPLAPRLPKLREIR